MNKIFIFCRVTNESTKSTNIGLNSWEGIKNIQGIIELSKMSRQVLSNKADIMHIHNTSSRASFIKEREKGFKS